MSERARARRALLRLTCVALPALALVHGACGRLDTVYLGKWHVGLAGAGALAEGGSGGAPGIGGEGAGGEGGTPRVIGLPSDPELWNGAVRLVAASSRLTVGSDGTSVALAPFGGASDQMWLLEADGQNVRFVHDEVSKASCLGSSLEIQTCADAPAFSIALLRERSEEAPSLFEIENETGECVTSTSDGLAWGACGQTTSVFYFEPSGWGRRAMQTAEHEVRMALVVKALASTSGSLAALDIDAEHVAAVSQSIDECLRIWLEAITDGRVTSSAEAFSSPRSVEQLGTSCGYAAPAASDLSADFSEYVPPGEFDGVVVYWRPGTGVDGGWSCSGLGGPNGGGLAYQAYGSDAAGWLACDVTPSDAFLQAYLAMAAQYYEAKGVPAPEGKLAGNVDAEYAAGSFNWNHFRRDYLLGRVIRADGTYGGLGPRAFRLGTIRAGAAP